MADAPIPKHVAQAYEEEEFRNRLNQNGGTNSSRHEYYIISPDSNDGELTKDDMARRERRKASNRNAARRCREKKMMEQIRLQQRKEEADRLVSDLRYEVQRLREENQQLHKLQAECTCKSRLSRSPTSSPRMPSPVISRQIVKQEPLLTPCIEPTSMHPTPASHPVPNSCWTGGLSSQGSEVLSSQESSSSSYGSDTALDLSQSSQLALDLSRHKQEVPC